MCSHFGLASGVGHIVMTIRHKVRDFVGSSWARAMAWPCCVSGRAGRRMLLVRVGERATRMLPSSLLTVSPSTHCEPFMARP